MPRSVRCVAVDQRGHGASDKPPPSSKPWTDSWTSVDQCYYPYPLFGADLAAVVAALGIKGALVCGHSMGAAAIAHAVLQQPTLFSSIIMCDPILLPQDRYTNATEARKASSGQAGVYATKRRRNFASPAEM